MAGLDGIKHQIDPGSPSDKDLYDLPPEEEKQIPTVCHDWWLHCTQSAGSAGVPRRHASAGIPDVLHHL